jgi:hypothetical protein
VVIEDAAVGGFLDEVGARAVVLRPDRYVLGWGDSPDEVAEVLRRALG